MKITGNTALSGLFPITKRYFFSLLNFFFFFKSSDETFETPKPIAAVPEDPNIFAPQNDKLQDTLKRHQLEMERLIKNISAKIHKLPTSSPPPEPFKYEDPQLDFDFTLSQHKGFDAQWQPVNGTRHKFYVYSAYYDARQAQRPLIRIIGKK